MKTSFRHPWRSSFRRAKPTGPVSRARRRRQPLSLEALEDRITLSLTSQMVLDINTNTVSSNPSAIVAVGSLAYFTADDGVHGVELWKSDGTAAGTTLVKDINSGSSNNYPAPSNLTNVNGTLFFSAVTVTTGWELWKSDGTAAGTVMVKDINLGSSSGDSSWPSSLTNVNGTLFFTAWNGTTSMELWKSDGTTAGTVMVKDIRPGDGGSWPT